MLDYASTGILDFPAPDQPAHKGEARPGQHKGPARLLPNELKALYRNVGRRAVIKDGTVLVHRGDTFSDLYAVCAGSFKAYTNDERGRERRLAFCMHGDVIGFDAIETGRHRVSFAAMEDSEVIIIPFETLDKLLARNPGLFGAIMRRMVDKLTPR